jgi:hypothetical protein
MTYVQNAENRRSSAFYPFCVTPQTAQIWVEPRELAILTILSIVYHPAPLGVTHYGSTHSPARLGSPHRGHDRNVNRFRPMAPAGDATRFGDWGRPRS